MRAEKEDPSEKVKRRYRPIILGVFLIFLTANFCFGENMARQPSPRQMPIYEWQQFVLGSGRCLQEIFFQYTPPNTSGSATVFHNTSSFEVWGGRPRQQIQRWLAIDITRSLSASAALDPFCMSLAWRFSAMYDENRLLYILVCFHPGPCSPGTAIVQIPRPHRSGGFLSPSGFPDIQPDTAPAAEGAPPHPGVASVAPQPEASGKTSAEKSSRSAPSSTGSMMPIAPGQNQEQPKSDAKKAANSPAVSPCDYRWLGFAGSVGLILLALVAVRFRSRRRRPISRKKKSLGSGEKQMEAYSQIHSLIMHMNENECKTWLDQYFVQLFQEPSLIETEASRLRLLLEQTASRLAVLQYEPTKNGGVILDLEQAHASFWRNFCRLLKMEDLSTFWRNIIDSSWEQQLVRHMVRALHFLEHDRLKPFRDLRDGLQAISLAAPEIAKRVGLDIFLGCMGVDSPEGKGTPLSCIAQLAISGESFPKPIVAEWKRISDQAKASKSLIGRLHDIGHVAAAISILNQGASTALRMHAVHLPPTSPLDLPTIVLFYLEPQSSHSVLSGRLKGFNLALSIRQTQEGYELLVRNRNTDDTLFIALTADTAQDMGRYSQQYGGRFELALVDAHQLRVLYPPQIQTPLDPSGETQRILEMIHNGNPREAISRFPHLAVDSDQLNQVWMELALYHCSSLGTGELAMARHRIERAVERHPEDWQVLSAMGILRKQEGRLGEALEFFSRSFQAFPYDVNNLVCYASTLLVAMGEPDIDRVRNLCGLAYDLNPRSTALRMFLQELEEAGIASRTYFQVCPVDSRIQR
ncbi:MAG: hypothetical protein WA705_12675 [Candidatus Ozemobacteraceae bacterium]